MSTPTPAITRAAERVEKHWRLWTGRELWPSRAERIAGDMLDAAVTVEEAQQVLDRHQVVTRRYDMSGEAMYTLCTCDAHVPYGPEYDFTGPFLTHQAEALRAAILGGAT